MPQMNKGGKFIYGISVVRSDGGVRFPAQAVKEYRIADEGKIYLFTGSKSTGGFCVTRQGLLLPSRLGHILAETPELLHYEAPMGAFLPYKGRFYCWTVISESGEIRLNVTEQELAQKSEVPTDFGETLSWDYLLYVHAHPISWNVPTQILYGERDNLTSLETVSAFARRHHANLTVMPGGEHWFHTPEQMRFLDDWIAADEACGGSLTKV